MKCIKNTDEVIRRVRDTHAAAQVESGDWVYIPKSEWKASRKAAEATKVAKKKEAAEEKKAAEKKKATKERKAVEKRRAAETNKVNKLLRGLAYRPQTKPSRRV